MGAHDDKPNGKVGASTGEKAKDGAFASLVQAESLIQLALLLPAATLIGWLAGVALDRWLHRDWIYIPGLLIGAAAGFVQIFRVIFALNKE
jgi:ATP synthase protein I